MIFLALRTKGGDKYGANLSTGRFGGEKKTLLSITKDDDHELSWVVYNLMVQKGCRILYTLLRRIHICFFSKVCFEQRRGPRTFSY